jgi:hypothetical protein
MRVERFEFFLVDREKLILWNLEKDPKGFLAKKEG